MLKLALASQCIIHEMASHASPADKTITIAASIPRDALPLVIRSSDFSRPAPAMVGMDNRRESRAAVIRSYPRKRAALIVTPERDAPGMSAQICAAPIRNAGDFTFVFVGNVSSVLLSTLRRDIN